MFRIQAQCQEQTTQNKKKRKKENKSKSKHLLLNVKSNKHTLRCVLDAAKSEPWGAAKGEDVSKTKYFTKAAGLAFLAYSFPDARKNIPGCCCYWNSK